jgi:hypothetical protein
MPRDIVAGDSRVKDHDFGIARYAVFASGNVVDEIDGLTEFGVNHQFENGDEDRPWVLGIDTPDGVDGQHLQSVRRQVNLVP